MYRIVKESDLFRKACIRILTLPLYLFGRSFRYPVQKALRHVSLPHVLAVMAKYAIGRPRKLRYWLSVCICVKDECDYILEWLEYYRLQGVDHFYIYNNNGTDGTRRLLTRYIDAGLVSWIDCPGEDMQLAIYNDAIGRFRDETRYLSFLDIDEFFVSLDGKTMRDEVECRLSRTGATQLLVHWVIYGTGGQMHKTDGLVIERFACHQIGTDAYTKAIFDPQAVLCAHVHACWCLGRTVSETGIPVQPACYSASSDHLRINHYAVKSREEFTAKRRRGRAIAIPERLDEEFFKRNDRNEICEPDLMKPYAEAVKRRLTSPFGVR